MRLALMLLVLCAACAKKPDADVPAELPAPPSATRDLVDAPAQPPAAGAALALDAAKAKAFVGYQEKLIPLTQQFVRSSAEMKQNAADGKYQGAIGTLRGYKDFNDRVGGAADQLDAARKASGLTESDVTALMEIEERVLARASAAAARVAEQVDKMEAALASMPQAARVKAQRNLDELKQLQKNVLGMQEMREKYGDGVVDAMIAQESELTRQAKALSQAH